MAQVITFSSVDPNCQVSLDWLSELRLVSQVRVLCFLAVYHTILAKQEASWQGYCFFWIKSVQNVNSDPKSGLKWTEVKIVKMSQTTGQECWNFRSIGSPNHIWTQGILQGIDVATGMFSEGHLMVNTNKYICSNEAKWKRRWWWWWWWWWWSISLSLSMILCTVYNIEHIIYSHPRKTIWSGKESEARTRQPQNSTTPASTTLCPNFNCGPITEEEEEEEEEEKKKKTRKIEFPFAISNYFVWSLSSDCSKNTAILGPSSTEILAHNLSCTASSWGSILQPMVNDIRRIVCDSKWQEGLLVSICSGLVAISAGARLVVGGTVLLYDPLMSIATFIHIQ